MRRRAFIIGLGCATGWPFPALPQRRLPRIGYLGPASADLMAPFYAAFLAGLRDFGYNEGENVEIEARFTGEGEERLSALASELVNLGVDVIVTGGASLYAAHKATKTIPIVVSAGGDLVTMGYADSLAHPGGNITGNTFFAEQLLAKRIALLKEVKPAMTSVGLLVTQSYPGTPRYLRALEAPVKALKVALQLIEVSNPSDCESALTAGPGASVGGLAVIDVPAFNIGPGPAAVAAAATHHGLPSAGGLSLASNGGLLGYGVDFIPLFGRAAYFVNNILKGAKPGDIPIEQATKFITVVNLKTAKALGIDIPPVILAAADEVIE
jgi:putative ABC transport system substrate-binding protein